MCYTTSPDALPTASVEARLPAMRELSVPEQMYQAVLAVIAAMRTYEVPALVLTSKVILSVGDAN